MIYITGDTHGTFKRINSRNIPTWTSMTRDDYLIICGDFGGVWDTTVSDEEYRNMMELAHCPFTILFVDGNHENFDRLERYPVVEFCGGKAHKIKDNIYHLMRGEYYEIDGKTFWVFGGARSHDISDGILDFDEIPIGKEIETLRLWNDTKRFFRIKNISWWEREMPSKEEMDYGRKNLEKHGNKVDYIITHDAPTYVASRLIRGRFEKDNLTDFLEEIAGRTSFRGWFFGHYHKDTGFVTTDNNVYTCMYKDIVKLDDVSYLS